MMNKKNSPRIVAVKYLLVVPALMAVLSVVQMSGLQAAEEYLDSKVSNADESVEYSDYITIENTPVVKKVIEDSDTTNAKYYIVGADSVKMSANGNVLAFYLGKTGSIVFRGNTLSKELVLIDGKEGTVNNIQPQSAERIEILKNESATRVYGTKGKNGVVLITTKKNTTPESHSVQDTVDQKRGNVISDYRARQGVFLTQDGENDLKRYYKEKIIEQQWGRSYLMTKIRTLGADPLIIIDEHAADFEALAQLTDDDVEKFSVMEGEALITLYGAKAKDGLVIVNTKNKIFDKGQKITIHDIGKDEFSDKAGSFVNFIFREGNFQNPFSLESTPLIIIDEREVKVQILAALLPEDIDNFSILKDAAAVAVYGDKAKNGAIVIKTKGKE